jgi:hypothetical protein
MNRFHTLALASLLLLGSANAKLKRLSPTEAEHYQALKVWMTEDDRKEWLKLKTEDERNAWLQERRLWDRFYDLSKPERDAILAGDVKLGWPLDKVLMAFGPPHLRTRVTGRDAVRSEQLVYRFEVTPDERVLVWQPKSKATHTAIRLFRLELTIDDGIVTVLDKLDGWD